jgi:hypothetical protein
MSGDSASPILRRGLLWLGVATAGGIGVELAVERHWTQPVQLVAGGALSVVLVALLLMMRSPSRATIHIARVLAVAAMLSAGLGIWEHVYSNYDVGPLDFHYENTWDSTPEASRWWLAVTKTVGPSPPLAPGALAQAGVCVLLATLRHPALRNEPR